MQTFKRVAIVAGLLLLIFAILVAWKYPQQRLKAEKLDYEVESPEEQLLKFEEQIMEDRAMIAQHDIFRPSRGEKDAGPFLNPLVSFDDERKGTAKIALPPEIREKLKDKNWVAYTPDFKTLKIDFSWMKKLHEFDHWAPDVNNPLVDKVKHPPLHTLPIPFYGDLIQWAKLRLIHGRLTQDMQGALKDVRQIARLIFTNDYLVSAMITVSILMQERRFVQNYNPKIMGDWKTIPEEHLTAAKRYFYGTPPMVDPRLSNEAYERFAGSDVGKCQMISEGIVSNHLVRDELKNHYSAEIRRFGKTIEDSLKICRKAVVHRVWEDPTWKALPLEIDNVKAENDSEGMKKFLKLSPTFREIASFIILRTGSANYLKQYHELPPKKSEE